MSQKRIQLTLFIDENKSEAIEKIRKEFNPEQYGLIKSHVTLCREDELESVEIAMQNLGKLNYSWITIDFGAAVRFSKGKGVLIPSYGDNEQFHQLRGFILKGTTKNPQWYEPHITLMHPRNSTCTDGIFQQIEKVGLPVKLTFRKVSLIEQEEKSKWNVLKEYELKAVL
ncbi:MAG: 2'-5' RNA ligase family protein [Chitinophagaceae bacterium]